MQLNNWKPHALEAIRYAIYCKEKQEKEAGYFTDSIRLAVWREMSKELEELTGDNVQS